MALFKLRDTEFDVGEHTNERVLWVDILQTGERFFSEAIQLDNQRRRKGLIEIVRVSETTVKVCFNNQLHNPSAKPNFPYTRDIILRDLSGRAIASAFSVGVAV